MITKEKAILKNEMKKTYLAGLVISVISVIVVLLLWQIGLLRSWENKFYNYKFLLRGLREPSKEIVIVAIDEESLSKFGRWPWPRSILARVIRNLKDAGVKVIATDIIFPERSQNKLHDKKLADAIKYADNVIGATHFEEYKVTSAEVVKGKATFRETTEKRLVEPIPEFKQAFAELGFTNAEPDADGVLRQALIKQKLLQHEHFSLNCSIAAMYLGKKPAELNLPEKIYANFAGRNNTYTRYSISMIYENTLPKAWLKNKIVLIGSTATGAFDHYPTPFENIFPGVEFHATVVDNIINNNYIRPVSNPIVIILIIVIGLSIAQIAVRTKPIVGFISFAIFLVIYFFILQYFLSKFNLHLDFFKPSLSMVFSFLGVMGYRLGIEEKEKRWIRKTFSYYLSPQVIKELTANPEKLVLGGERKTLTVLFSDIYGFTSIAEKLNPEETVSVLNEHLSAMTEIIFRYDGTLDKFIGDAVMAFWGAPIPQENHAERAVFCAIEMLERLKELQERWKLENKPVIDIGIGINTGEMLVGNMGSNQRMDYTVIGDNVNLASRLETLTRQYTAKLIISEYTYQFVKDKIEVKPLGEVKLKGREKAVNIFEVLGRKRGK
ncbi:MAG: adenylate/guanylate cyclase domain-containing protein [Elusimicrobiota bacterium]|nr:adenylate/guanylate cyclase domain-containing protein [Elusimicrobiota bacterium]